MRHLSRNIKHRISMTEITKCPITGLDFAKVQGNSYSIEIDGDYRFIMLGASATWLTNEERFIKNRYLLAGAIIDKQLSEENENGVYWFTLTSDSFDEKISRIIYPKTPKAKLDNLLKTLYQLQNIDGELVHIDKAVEKPEFYYKHFFKSADECYYYFKELQYQGLINCVFSEVTDKPYKFRITFKGLNYCLELAERGDLSKKCFVAMSFDPQMKET
jgi:hypothetical protein